MTVRKAFLRGLLGFPLGVFIAYSIIIFISLSYNGLGTGIFYSVPPDLIPEAGSEMKAALLQYFLSGMLGFAFAAGSAIWQIESWSITRQTVTHFIIVSAVMYPTAYVCHWIKHDAVSFIVYMLIFSAIYSLIWLFYFKHWKNKLNAINKKLQ